MQILAGKYRRRHLQSTLSPRVRPTARRLREALFDFLGTKIIEARFLDLCAGSGAVGIEALSRGARHATFVERSAKMCRFIEMNLELCGVPQSQIKVIQDEAVVFLRRAGRNEAATWDVAFLDPPYAHDYSPVISLIGTGVMLKSRSGVLVVEHHCDNHLRDSFGILRRWHVIRQGESCLSFFECQ